MLLFDLNKKISSRELRWFAGLWFPAFAFVVGSVVRRTFQAPVAAAFIWTIAGIIAITGLCSPRFIRPVYVGLTRLSYPLGWLFSHLLLGLLYFGVITPIGFLVRRVHDPMERKFDAAADSYWKPRGERSKESYVRQF